MHTIGSFLKIRSSEKGVSSVLRDMAQKVIIGVEPSTEGIELDMASTKIVHYGGVQHGKNDPAQTPEEAETIGRYETAVALFLLRLKVDQEQGNGTDAVMVDYHAGRKYDKVLVTETREGKKLAPSVRYFVNRETGEIFGAKSPTAPNERHFFNTIFTADKWDWSGFYGKPVSDDSVRMIKSYGVKRKKSRRPVYVHYTKVDGTQPHSDDPPAPTAVQHEELVPA